ncbi:Hint domain-containing protein [Asaia sp. BMEF1]|uniref:Hint domain-containing protein n=1 Tax=Asaia sp. BMEF1 TaxID=3155932 RepID=UPI003F664F8B
MIEIGAGQSAQYKDIGEYFLNGGTLDLTGSKALIANGKLSTTKVTLGNASSMINVDFKSDAMASTPGSYDYRINVQNTPTQPLLINFDLGPWPKKVTYEYRGGFTTVIIRASVNAIGVGNVSVSSYMTVYIVIPGNPNGLTVGEVTQYPFVSGSNGGMIVVRCFARGTLIQVPGGQKTVEMIEVGDAVVTKKHGGDDIEKVVWVGKRVVEVGPTGERLVVVKADAFGAGRPFKDLRLTSEHCVLFEGCFIPVRLLVNECSIYYDEPHTTTVYHIETEKHSVLSANGLEAESFLDATPLPYDCDLSGDYVVVGKARHSWERDAAAPLRTDEAFARKAHEALRARAEALKILRRRTETQCFTSDPELTLVLDDDTEIQPIRRAGARYIFALPQDVSRVWLKSRSFQPHISQGAYIDDRRTLGVLVGDVTVFTPLASHSVDHHLHDEMLLGWHPLEGASHRWTEGGRAELPLVSRLCLEGSVVSIQILAGGPYLTTSEDTFGAAKRAGANGSEKEFCISETCLS